MKQFLIIFLLSLTGYICNAQMSNRIDGQKETVEVIMKNGDILRGSILSVADSTIVLSSQTAGPLTLRKSDILETKYFKEKNTGNRQVYINLASRYFFSPSAINMKKGDAYYQNTMLIINSFNYAVTDNFTLGGGVEIISLLARKPIFFINPKLSYSVGKNMHVGAGVLYFDASLISGNGNAHFLLGYGNFTYGNNDHNVTVNLGSDLEHGGSPMMTLCGFTRVGAKFGLLTENWLLTSNIDYNIFSFGGRVIGRKNLFDFGLITNTSIFNSGITGIPFISYTLRM